MTTRTEHTARLTEMSVRAQEAADWLAGQDDAPMADDLAKKDAHVERLLTDIRGLVQRAEAAERERDAAMQAHADDIAEKDAEIARLTAWCRHYEDRVDNLERAHETAERERDTLRQERDAATEARREAERMRGRMVTRLREVRAALNTPHGINETPRLVRELRDERDKALGHLGAVQGERDAHEDELADLKARAVVLPENWREQVFDATDDSLADYVWERVTRLIESWRAEPASREPEQAASPGPAHPDGTSEAHFQTRPRSAGESECTASREPEAPGFYIGDQVWHMPAGERGTVYATRDDARLCSVAFDSGQRRVWESDLRHVYDADHEPPEGVTVMRGMGNEHYCDYFLVRSGTGWDWNDEPVAQPGTGNSYPWAKVVRDASGPLVEWRPGDAV